MGIVSDEFATARMQKYVARPLRKEFKAGPAWISKPIRAVGDFFFRLTDLGKKRALRLAKIAGTLPRPELDRRIEQLKKDIKKEGDQNYVAY